MNAEYFNARFTYCAKTGAIDWKLRPVNHFKTKLGWSRFNSRFPEEEAGWIDRKENGAYRRVEVDGKTYSAHYIAWVMIHGEPPRYQIDHVNGNGLDNREANLRDVSQAENARNRKVPTTNKSGVIGVHWRAQSNAWRAQISRNGSQSHLGLFKRKEDAVAARKKAEIELGYHKNHGRKCNSEFDELSKQQNN